MESIRGSISSIPSVVSNMVGSLPFPTTIFPMAGPSRMITDQTADPVATSSTEANSPPPSLMSDDETIEEKSHAIPNSLITEKWQFILEEDASVEDLENAIDRCKDLVTHTEEFSIERKWLVRHLVELRFRLNEIVECLEDPKYKPSNTMTILGHHFIPGKVKSTSVRQYCDHCTGIIWSVVQASYVCSDCNYTVHYKCVQSIRRECAHIAATERKIPIERISPEVGLHKQFYKCAECSTRLNYRGTWIEARLCDYNGLYYCPSCHWNDTISVPARIIHNWDFKPRKICRASLQELNILYELPIINLETRNPKLFIFIPTLSLIKKLRENLGFMRQYLSECRIATSEKLLEAEVGNRRYLIQSSLMYSITDLVTIENGSIVEFLNKIHLKFDKHIRSCEICSGKGYLCEICGNNETIFPYDDAAVQCTSDEKCQSIYHRVCWIRKNMKCPKCLRLQERREKDKEIIETVMEPIAGPSGL